MKRYVKAAAALKDIKITGDYADIVQKLFDIDDTIFDTVSRIETQSGWKSDPNDRDEAVLRFFYGRSKGGGYFIPLDADEDELEEIAEHIYHNEYTNRYVRRRELSRTSALANEGKIRLTATALLSRLIKARFGISSHRDPSGRNSKYVYYPIDYTGDEYHEFYEREFVPFIDEVREEYPDLSIYMELSKGYGPRIEVFGPDYAWDKKTHEATPLKQ